MQTEVVIRCTASSATLIEVDAPLILPTRSMPAVMAGGSARALLRARASAGQRPKQRRKPMPTGSGRLKTRLKSSTLSVMPMESILAKQVQHQISDRMSE